MTQDKKPEQQPKVDPAAERVEKGKPKEKDVNPLAPPVNIQGGG